MRSMPIRSLADLVRVRAETLADRCAYTFLADGDDVEATLTYGELDRSARGIAARIRERAKPGDAVILAYPAGLDFIAAFCGCLYAGVVAVPVEPANARRGNERLAAIAADCDAALVLATAESAKALATAGEGHPALARVAIIVADRHAPAEDAHTSMRASAEIPAFLQYTSGSTQSPRGVRVSHANVFANLLAIHAAEGNSGESRGLSWLPAYHDMGLIEGILEPLYGGYPAWLMPHAAFVQRPVRWLRSIARYGITVTGGPNFAYELCVRRVDDAELERVDLRSWRVAYCGAEPIKVATMRAFADRFAGCGFRRSALRPVYGLAEATLLVTASSRSATQVNVVHAQKACLDHGRYVPAAADDPGSIALVACGRPIEGTTVAIVDPERRSAVEPGIVGEIWVSGPGVASGYRTRRSGARAFVDCAIDGVRRRWLRTGDLGFFAGGELIVSGRMKDLIIVRGRKIHPHDLEQTAERCDPRILPNSAAAFASHGPESEQVVLCVEIPRSLARMRSLAQAQPLAALADTIRECIYRNHAVAVATVAFVRLGALARTSSGKLMRYRLRRDFFASTIDVVRRFDAQLLQSGADGRML